MHLAKRLEARYKSNNEVNMTLLTVYFGTPNMFITPWFGFVYGTNLPLGTLILYQVHL
jgi:hypothetical protein